MTDIAAMRKARGWSQHELAQISGIPRATIAKLETGDNRGSSARVQDALRRVFGSDAMPSPPHDGRSTRGVLVALCSHGSAGLVCLQCEVARCL